MRFHILKKISIACVLGCMFGVASMAFPVHAQDWSASDSSIEARRLERYQQLVDQSPEESYAFHQLMQATGKGTAYEKLLRTYEGKVAKSPANFNLRMVLGHMYRYGGRLDQAMDAYREAEKIKSTALVALSIARVEAECRNYAEASAAYARALSLTTSKDQKTEILRAMAEIALSRRDMATAEDCFSQLIALDDSVFLRRELSQLYAQNRMYPQARESLEKAKSARGITTDEKYRLDLDIAALWEQAGDDQAAARIYETLDDQLPAAHWMKREIASRRIEMARRTGNVEDLLKILETQWKSPTLEQRLELAQLYDEIGRTSEAENQYKKAIAAKADNAEAREKYIAFLKGHGRTEDANKARLERLKIKAFQNIFDYHYELYEAYIQQKRMDDAIKVLDQARNVFRLNFDTLQRIAEAYMLHGRSAKAQEIYATQVKQHPNDINAIEALGDYYDIQGMRQLALETWQKIEHVSLDKTTKLETLARIYDEHGYADEAVALYARVVKDNPGDCQLLRSYAEVLSRANRTNDAVEAYENLSDVCHNDAMTQVAARAVAQLQRSRGNADKAMQQAISRAQASPQDASKTRFAAMLALSLDMPEKAIPLLEAYTASHAKDADMMQNLVSLYNAANMTEKARVTLEGMTTQSTANARRSALIALATFYEEHGAFEEAQQSLSDALDIDANDAETNMQMADILMKRRLYADAANYYQVASQIDPQNALYAYKHATSLSMYGQDEEADYIYTHIVLSATDETLILRSAEHALDYHAWKGDLEQLEAMWRPLMYAQQRRELYVGLLLKVAELQARPHIMHIRTQPSQTSLASRHALSELASRYSRALTEALLSNDTGLSAQGLQAAEWYADPNVIETLCGMFDASSANALAREQQLQAVRAMAHAGRSVAVPLLTSVYNNALYVRALREHALWALGLIPSAESRQTLTQALQAPLDSFRMLAILGLVRQNAYSEQIEQMAQNDPSRRVQNIAAWAVATSGGAQALRRIAGSLQPSFESDQFAETLARSTSDNSTDSVFHPYQLWLLSRLDAEVAAQRILEVRWLVSGGLHTMSAKVIRSNDVVMDLSRLTTFEAQNLMFDTRSGFYENSVALESFLDDAMTSAMPSETDGTAAWFEQHRTALANAVRSVLSGRLDTIHDAARVRLAEDLTHPFSPFASALDNAAVYETVRDTLSGLKPQLSQWLSACSGSCTPEQLSRSMTSLKLLARFDLGFVHEISAIAADASNQTMQFAAIQALGLSKNASARKALLELAHHKDWLVRTTVIENLDPEAPDEAAQLHEALGDEYAMIRDAARMRLER